MELYKKINKLGTTICLTTHYLEEAEKLCDTISIINYGKKIKEDSKQNLLDIISNKTVSFILNDKCEIPFELKKYNPSINQNKLILNYDKNETNLKKIINILNKNNIIFEEINT